MMESDRFYVIVRLMSLRAKPLAPCHRAQGKPAFS
jgi:hypothetical protein